MRDLLEIRGLFELTTTRIVEALATIAATLGASAAVTLTVSGDAVVALVGIVAAGAALLVRILSPSSEEIRGYVARDVDESTLPPPKSSTS